VGAGVTYFTSGLTSTFDGSQWVIQNVSPAPPVRSFFGFSPEPTGTTLLFGGTDVLSSQYLNDTWRWNGTGWTQLSPLHSPPPSEGPALVEDGANSRVLLVGGYNGGLLRTVWAWDGSDWSELTSAALPNDTSWVGVAYDPQRKVVVALTRTSDLNDAGQPVSKLQIAELAGDAWTTRYTFPSSTTSAAIVGYDPTSAAVLFGGSPSPGLWNGSAWIPLPTTAQLPPRADCVALDEGQNQCATPTR
jgi:hypothetical protein